jgi:hypothetical protein
LSGADTATHLDEAAGITRGAAIEANRIHMMESVVRTVGSKIAKDIEGGMVLRY